MSEEDNEFTSPIYYLTDGTDPSQTLENAELKEVAHARRLDERSRRIIEARWLQQDDTKATTLHELASELGVSAERVRQLESKAMAKIRNEITTEM